MPTDIVERLRSCAQHAGHTKEWDTHAWIEAADEIEHLRAVIEQLKADYSVLGERWSKATHEIAQLRYEISEWHDCPRYDPLMSGRAFKGWDRSQMDRCRKRFIEEALSNC